MSKYKHAASTSCRGAHEVGFWIQEQTSPTKEDVNSKDRQAELRAAHVRLGLSSRMAGLSQVVMLPWKISAATLAFSCSEECAENVVMLS